MFLFISLPSHLRRWQWVMQKRVNAASSSSTSLFGHFCTIQPWHDCAEERNGTNHWVHQSPAGGIWKYGAQKRGRQPMESVSNPYWSVQHSSVNAAASCDQAEEGQNLNRTHYATLCGRILDHLLHGCGCVGLEYSSQGSHVGPARLHVPDCGQISGGLMFGAARPNLIMPVPAPDWKGSGAGSQSPLNTWGGPWC